MPKKNELTLIQEFKKEWSQLSRFERGNLVLFTTLVLSIGFGLLWIIGTFVPVLLLIILGLVAFVATVYWLVGSPEN